ncbi:glycosyltransferase family 9 protein [Azonexus sp. IMCC34842]|uniref:glycosyltransferase family 9 protein n=1 Tax=Azonexus sp. IMCC34842 TaxID=3420950 RepID=UPI003D13B038
MSDKKSAPIGVSSLHTCVRHLRSHIWEIQDFLARVACSQPDEETVLVVRVDNIGDFILWLGAAEHLKRHFAQKRLTLAANQVFAELAEKCGYFEKVIPIDIQRLDHDRLYRFRTLRQVRQVHASIAIQSTYSRVFSTGDALIRASGAPQRIGSASDLSNISASQRNISDRWYTRLVPAESHRMTEIERHCEFLHGLGVENVTPALTQLGPVAVFPSWFRTTPRYLVIFPGASSTAKIWPASSYGAIARAIHKAYGWRLIVCGATTDYNLAVQVIEHSKVEGALNLCGKTSLPELVEIIRGASLLIGNDTSAAHIAPAVGTPSVCLLGGGHFGRFMPYPPTIAGHKPIAVYHEMPCFNCNWQCHLPHAIDAPVPCISMIHVDSVLQAAHQAIEDTSNN